MLTLTIHNSVCGLSDLSTGDRDDFSVLEEEPRLSKGKGNNKKTKGHV